MGILPHCRTGGLLSVEPEAIDRRIAKLNNRAAIYVFVEWANLNKEDATWELYDDLVQRQIIPLPLGKPAGKETVLGRPPSKRRKKKAINMASRTHSKIGEAKSRQRKAPKETKQVKTMEEEEAKTGRKNKYNMYETHTRRHTNAREHIKP
ncbi:reverse transcriptase [Tanacetum coccineum]